MFEIVENTQCGMHIINKYLTYWPGGKPHVDSLLNIFGDQVFFALGWIIAKIVDHAGQTFGWYKAHIN